MGFSSIAKWILVLFNCLFFLVGAALLAIGLYVIFSPYSFEILAVLDNAAIRAGVYIIVCLGAAIFVVAALGLFGACCKSKIMLGLYAFVLFVIIAIQLAAGIVTILYKSHVDDFVTSQLATTMDSYVAENETDSYSVGWNSIQIFFECCGTNNYTDWASTDWGTDGSVYKYQPAASYPISCCAVEDTSVILSGTIDTSSFTDVVKCYGGGGESIPNTYMAGSGEGCYNSFQDYIIQNSVLVGGVGIGLAAFEILLFLLALVVCFTIDKEEDVV